MISDECTKLADVAAPLVCHLPTGHPGPWHYDAQDDITWKAGEPDGHAD